MYAIKAIYRNGRIELLSPLLANEEAELVVVVLDRAGESMFNDIGMVSFDCGDDQDIDWEEVFDAKSR